MNQAKSRFRIITANGMIAMTIVMAIITIYFAKSNSRQNSLLEENYRRHIKFRKGEGQQSSRVGLVTNNDKEEVLEEMKR